MVPGAQQQVTETSDSGGRLFLCELLKDGEKKKKNSNQICSLRCFIKEGGKDAHRVANLLCKTSCI